MTAVQTELITTTNRRGEVVPELNVPLIRKLIGWAEQDEKWVGQFDYLGEIEWAQETWGRHDGAEPLSREWAEMFVKDANVCGTAHCQAGGAVVESDYRILYPQGGGPAEYCRKIEWTGTYDERGRKVWRDIEGTDEYIADVGRRLLGFTDDESGVYFEGDNDIPRLKEFANYFALDRGDDLIFEDAGIWDRDGMDDDED